MLGRWRLPFRDGFSWAILDQILVSGGNFATTLVLSRWLTPLEFGTYALINSGIVVASGLHSNIIISPLVVFGGVERGQKKRTYPSVALALGTGLSPLWMVLLIGIAIYLHRVETGIYAVLAFTAWQYQETVRRGLFAVWRHRDAMWGDFISYPGQALVILALMRLGYRSLNTAFLVMAATSLAAALLQLWQSDLRRVSMKECQEIGQQFWRIAKWLVVSCLAGILSAPLLPWMINWSMGRSAVGAFQAVLSVMNLSNPFLLSISAVVIPAVAASKLTVLRTVWRYTLQFELTLCPFLLVMLLWPHWVLGLMFGVHSPYVQYASALRIGALACALAVPLSVIQNAFAALEETRNNAIIQAGGSILGILCAVPIIHWGGVTGGVFAETFGRFLRLSWGAALLGRHSNQKTKLKMQHENA